jgi:hypothetical protein
MCLLIAVGLAAQAQSPEVYPGARILSETIISPAYRSGPAIDLGIKAQQAIALEAMKFLRVQLAKKRGHSILLQQNYFVFASAYPTQVLRTILMAQGLMYGTPFQ